MKFCNNCGVRVSDLHEVCPLCQGSLSECDGTDKVSVPHLPAYTSFTEESTSKILLSVKSLILSVGMLSVLLNIKRPKAGFWSVVIIVALAALWWWLSIAIQIKRSIIKKFYQLVFIAGSVAVFMDVMFGWKKWSLNYVVPILITASIIIIMIVDKAMKISATERIFYTFLLVMTGLLFALLILADIITFNIPTYILLFVCILSICHSLLFERRELINELQKRFHI